MRRRSKPKFTLLPACLMMLFTLLVGTACDPALIGGATPAVDQAGEAAAETPPTVEQEQAEATPPPPVMAETLTSLNFRQGPGINYPIIDSLPEASQIAIVGRNEDSSWLVGQRDAGSEVWLSGDPEFVKVELSLVAELPVHEALPPTYNASNEQVNNMLTMIPLVVHHEQKITCASHGGLNNLLPEVVSGHVLGPHAGDFIYDGNNVLFKYENGTFQLIRENPIARFENGEESLPFATAMQLVQRGDIIWNGNFGDPGRGVLGCDLSTP